MREIELTVKMALKLSNSRSTSFQSNLTMKIEQVLIMWAIKPTLSLSYKIRLSNDLIHAAQNNKIYKGKESYKPQYTSLSRILHIATS